VVRGDGEVVTNKAAAAKARALEIEFNDGRLTLDKTGKPARGPLRTKPTPPDQGSLF